MRAIETIQQLIANKSSKNAVIFGLFIMFYLFGSLIEMIEMILYLGTTVMVILNYWLMKNESPIKTRSLTNINHMNPSEDLILTRIITGLIFYLSLNINIFGLGLKIIPFLRHIMIIVFMMLDVDISLFTGFLSIVGYNVPDGITTPLQIIWLYYFSNTLLIKASINLIKSLEHFVVNSNQIDPVMIDNAIESFKQLIPDQNDLFDSLGSMITNLDPSLIIPLIPKLLIGDSSARKSVLHIIIALISQNKN